MIPAIPYSFGSVASFTISSSTPSKDSHVSRCNAHGRARKSSPFQPRVVLPQSLTFTLLQQHKTVSSQSSRFKVQALASVGSEVAIDESNPTIAEEVVESSVPPQVSEVSSSAPKTLSSNQGRRPKTVRKSDMPPVNNEELLPGASFTGKVRSIQPFGAFVDFGAFTDGLVHVSNLSNGFVKDVGSFVSVGQEVKVKILEANMETGRISLTMRDGEETSRSTQRGDEASESFNKDNKPRSPRKNASRPNNQKRDNTNQKTSKFVKGQVLDGTVKNLTRSGAYISLPEGEEGFLPTSEESEGFSILGSSSLVAGQEVSVRVLRITRGQVTLTMKKEEDLAELNKMLNQGVVYAPRNPFELAFRKNKDIASFLDEREKVKSSSELVVVSEAPENVEETSAAGPESLEESVASSELADVSGSLSEEGASVETPALEEENKVVVGEEESIDSVSQDKESSIEAVAEEEEKEVESVTAAVAEAEKIPEEKVTEEPASAIVSPTDVPSVEETLSEEPVAASISPSLVKQLREETGAGMMDCKKALEETSGDLVKAQEFLRKKGLASADKKASRATTEGRIASYVHDSRIGVLVEVNCETDFVSRGSIFKDLVEDIAMQVAACPQVEYLAPEDVPEELINKEREIEMQKEDLQSKPEQFRSKIVEGRMRKRLEELALLEQPYIKNDKLVIKDLVKQTIATIGENIKVKRFIRFNLGEGLEKKSQDFAAEVAAQTAAISAAPSAKEESAEEKPEVVAPPAEEKPAVVVSAALVKQLREETGAGMMDCKKALTETGGNVEKAQEYLRKKGLASADKKASRLASEGRVGSYIHDARIGVLIEVNCETDFVGRSEKFKELVDDLAMQVAACPEVKFVSIEDIPQDLVAKEKEIEMQREDLASKPENIREKIVEGRISKRLGELVLLEQPFIKDDGLLVKDLVKQTVAAIGENIRVRRFARFTLGQSSD